MKRAVILHGTDGNPDVNWLPWAKAELEKRGYDVFSPLLPNNHTPNKKAYEDFLKNSQWDFRDNVVIGHSSGATTLLNLLGSEWFPKIQTAVFVGAFLNEKLTKEVDWYEPGQFDGLFLSDDFDIDAVKQKTTQRYFIHGDNDPYCDLQDTIDFAKKVDGKVIIVKDGQHLSSNTKELPDLLPIIDA